MDTPRLPWYRHPIVWLVIALPAATVPAGLATLALAMRGADSVVHDDFRVEGLAINQDPVRDAAARRLGVRARVAIGDGAAAVTLSPGHALVPDRLVLLLSHATRATEDREVALERRTDGGYVGPKASLPGGHWYVELAPPDRAWRLTGELGEGVLAATLEPRTGP